MGMGDNGGPPGARRRRAYKKDQKNVSVYIGKSAGWEAKALEAVCATLGWKESQLFRNLFFDFLVQQELWDDKKDEPVKHKIEKMLSKASSRGRMPSMLDLEQDDDGG